MSSLEGAVMRMTGGPEGSFAELDSGFGSKEAVMERECVCWYQYQR